MLLLVVATGAAPGIGSAAAPAPPPIRALPGTIVYIRAGNIWTFVPASGALRQITRDGGYRGPTMADDGTIGAVQRIGGRSHFVTISPSGRKRAFAPGEFINLIRAGLSPDGRLFAFVYVVVSPILSNPARVGLTFAHGWGATGIAGVAGAWNRFSSSYYDARWMGPEFLILSGGAAYVYRVRGGEPGWDYHSPYAFGPPFLEEDVYEVARNGSRALAYGRARRVVNNDLVQEWAAIVYRPARPEEQVTVEFDLYETRGCVYDSPPGRCTVGWLPDFGLALQGEPGGAAIAPDGGAIAVADRRGLLIVLPRGPNVQLLGVDPQGSEPAWSPFQPRGAR